MTVFFDTTVLVASSSRSHPHFIQASAVVARVAADKDKGFISQHSLAEMYAALTRMPVTPRIHPMDAARLIQENIVSKFEMVRVEEEDYLKALTRVSESGWAGAKIYDALLLCCAEKSRVQRIYTFNLKDFKLMAPSHMQHLICLP